jgi:fermentation-respiration switch protein FrsA (DUF1100 family)
MKITEQSCFYPDGYVYFDPSNRGFLKDDLWLEDRIHGWHIHPKPDNARKQLIVHLHGNAENMTSHLAGAMFLLEAGFPILAFDYSGYGQSRGAPTLRGIQDDARAVFSHVFAHPETFGGSVFGLGQSMGAYTLARILPDFPGLKGAILEAGLHSFHALFCEAYPGIECTVPSEGYSALDTLPLSTVPKLFIHGTADGVVPFSHSVEMHEKAAQPKELVILEGVGHIDAFISRHSMTYREKIMEFIRTNS